MLTANNMTHLEREATIGLCMLPHWPDAEAMQAAAAEISHSMPRTNVAVRPNGPNDPQISRIVQNKETSLNNDADRPAGANAIRTDPQYADKCGMPLFPGVSSSLPSKASQNSGAPLKKNNTINRAPLPNEPRGRPTSGATGHDELAIATSAERSKDSWATEFFEGQYTTLGLKRDMYNTRDVPGKKPQPIFNTKKPSAKFLLYTILAEVPGGAMTKENLRKTLNEWCGADWYDQTVRAALCKSIKTFAWEQKGDQMFWHIMDINEQKTQTRPGGLKRKDDESDQRLRKKQKP